jgi:hypothetical protein
VKYIYFGSMKNNFIMHWVAWNKSTNLVVPIDA